MQRARVLRVEAVSARFRPWLSWGYVRYYGKRKESTQRKPRPNRKVRLPVILTEEVPNLGGRGDVVRVKRGYGRNYLLPKEKAVYYTPENIKHYDAVPLGEGETQLSVVKERIKKLLARKVVTIPSEDGWPLFEAHIAVALRRQLQLHVPLDRVMLTEPIRRLGATEVNIAMDDDELLPVRLEVVPAINT